MSNAILTGKPSVDRPWLKYYPQVLMDNLQVPPCTLRQYLEFNMPSPDTIAMHYYGVDITWREVFERADACAKSLRVLGFTEGDQDGLQPLAVLSGRPVRPFLIGIIDVLPVIGVLPTGDKGRKQGLRLGKIGTIGFPQQLGKALKDGIHGNHSPEI